MKMHLNPKSTALLVMDCQVHMIDSLTPAEKEQILGNLTRAIRAARVAGVRVIYVALKFRKGYPEVASSNVVFSRVKEAGIMQEGAPSCEICPEISPLPDEAVVTKKRISAFAGSDLQELLRAQSIDTLVLTGVSSVGVVESTARAAADLDYRLFVLGDCCSDRDPGVNEIALSVLLPRISTVCNTEDFVSALSIPNSTVPF